MSLGLFFGLFFGLDYPEIKRAEYIPTICTVQSETIESRYCCYKDCDTTCGDTQCATATMTNNSQNINDHCPIDGPQAICDDVVLHIFVIVIAVALQIIVLVELSVQSVIRFDQDLAKAQEFLMEHPVTSTLYCYYNPDNPLE
ncbi:10862_t:CDS:2, partial [Entrophospora sp. SA101]